MLQTLGYALIVPRRKQPELAGAAALDTRSEASCFYSKLNLHFIVLIPSNRVTQ